MSHFFTEAENRTIELPVAKELPVVNYQWRRRRMKWGGRKGKKEEEEEKEEEEGTAALAQVSEQNLVANPPDIFCTLNY